VVYELTQYGRELDEVLLALGRWGAQSMGQPEPDDIFTTDALLMAMRASYQGAGDDAQSSPEPVKYELRVGTVVISISVRDGQLGVTGGPQADPDLVIETEHGFAALLAGRTSPTEAIESGSVRLSGDPELLTRFAKTFRV
jgi:SCP-2 sterol transfer family